MTAIRCWLIALACTVAPTAAAGEPPTALKPEAQRHLDAGLALYTAEDYAAAGREFELAYAIDPAPALLYAWAQAKRYGGHCAEALDLYRRYLEADLNQSQVVAAQDGVASCTKELAAGAPRESPAPPAGGAPPGERTPPPRPWYRNKLGAALATGGIVGIGVGVGFFYAAERSVDRAHDAAFRDEFGALLDEATTRRRIGAAALGVGGALLAGGVLSFVIDRDRRPHDLAVTTDGTTVLVWGTF